MKQIRVVSIAQYKAERIFAGKAVDQPVAPTLPEANRLWELLDKNIDLSVWLQAR